MIEIQKITSGDNRRLVNARRVRDGKEPNLIFIEGQRLTVEALRSGLVIRECFVTADFRDRELLDAVATQTTAIAELSDGLFRSIADTNQPQGIILIAQRPVFSSASIEARLNTSALPIVVFLKEVNNPSNLGAVLRTAEAAGAAGIIASKNSADVYSPKALRAAMGAGFRLPVWDNAEFDEVLRWAEAVEVVTTAADASAPVSYTEIDWDTSRLLILGSEAHGLSMAELASVDERIKIPMENGVESLNLAVSAGVFLFEAKRQLAIG